jgi:hypothetical protein
MDPWKGVACSDVLLPSVQLGCEQNSVGIEEGELL